MSGSLKVNECDVLVNGLAIKILSKKVSRITVGADLMNGSFAGCRHFLDPEELCLEMPNFAYTFAFHDAHCST